MTNTDKHGVGQPGGAGMIDVPKPDGVSQDEHEDQLQGIEMRLRMHTRVVP